MHPFHLTQPRIPTLQQRTEEFINVLAPVLASPAPTLKSLIMDYTSDLAPEWFDLLCEELKLFNGAIVKFPVLETLSLGCPASITDAFYATLETAPLITHLRFSQTQKIPLRAPIVPLATLKSFHYIYDDEFEAERGARAFIVGAKKLKDLNLNGMAPDKVSAFFKPSFIAGALTSLKVIFAGGVTLFFHLGFLFRTCPNIEMFHTLSSKYLMEIEDFIEELSLLKKLGILHFDHPMEKTQRDGSHRR